MKSIAAEARQTEQSDIAQSSLRRLFSVNSARPFEGNISLSDTSHRAVLNDLLPSFSNSEQSFSLNNLSTVENATTESEEHMGNGIPLSHHLRVEARHTAARRMLRLSSILQRAMEILDGDEGDANI